MEILRAAAESHPMVLLSPKPTVLMTGFAADTMNFEVKALVRDINAGGSVRSDITVEVARRFNAAGIQSRNGLAPLPVA
ncbi:MscS Mechanosensitive ion channel [Ketogulonicigenium vulgare Y25]|nr:mechanosensitive ion channel domain-containing protein [Ketogulonicigenium vulgare]ADO42761.1 MscS Mechanosensitive ion channel [Ketogulonicigenium vulgare Y25]